MGYALGYKLLNPENILQLVQNVPKSALPATVQNPPLPPVPVVQQKENIQESNAVIPFEPNFNLHDDLDDFDLMKVLSEVENENMAALLQWAKCTNKDSTTTTSKQVMKWPAPNPMPMMFADCQITGNITINLNK